MLFKADLETKAPAKAKDMQASMVVTSINPKSAKHISPMEFEIIVSENENDVIKVFVRGNKVIAQAFKKGAEKPYANAIAKCHPEDEFNYEAGVKLVCERLNEKIQKHAEKNKHYVIDLRTNERFETGIDLGNGYKTGDKVVVRYHGVNYSEILKDNSRTMFYNIPLNKATIVRKGTAVPAWLLNFIEVK